MQIKAGVGDSCSYILRRASSSHAEFSVFSRKSVVYTAQDPPSVQSAYRRDLVFAASQLEESPSSQLNACVEALELLALFVQDLFVPCLGHFLGSLYLLVMQGGDLTGDFALLLSALNNRDAVVVRVVT